MQWRHLSTCMTPSKACSHGKHSDCFRIATTLVPLGEAVYRYSHQRCQDAAIFVGFSQTVESNGI